MEARTSSWLLKDIRAVNISHHTDYMYILGRERRGRSITPRSNSSNGTDWKLIPVERHRLMPLLSLLHMFIIGRETILLSSRSLPRLLLNLGVSYAVQHPPHSITQHLHNLKKKEGCHFSKRH